MKSPHPIGFVQASLIALALPGSANAIPIKLTDATPTYLAQVANCDGLGTATYTNCTSTTAIDITHSLVGSDASFKQSFDAWNAGNAAGSKWTLKDGGKLPGGTFQVSTFDAVAKPGYGGLEIQIDWTYAGADKGDYRWAQGLYDNYTATPKAIVEPFFEMDVLTDPALVAPPLYAYQFPDRHFEDLPRAIWPSSFFVAEAFLAQVDTTLRVLTIYEGVSYEFHLDIPEPPGLLLALLGIGSLAAIRRRA